MTNLNTLYAMIPTIWHSRQGKTMETGKMSICQGVGGREG